jgi:hypothetical protein
LPSILALHIYADAELLAVLLAVLLATDELEGLVPDALAAVA